MDRLLVADAIGRTPSSSEYKRLLSSSRAYGLTTGTEKADYVVPTELGLKIVKPLHPEEALHAKVQACLNVELLGRLWRQFNKSKLPDAKFLKNTLERTYDLDGQQAEEFAGLAVENAKFCGVLQDISGAKYIRLEEPSLAAATSSAQQRTPANDVEEEEAAPEDVAQFAPPVPLEELKKILDGFGIQYVVAVDEPHAGRPISAKVAQLMNECTAGIFVFTKDELFFRKQRNGEMEETWRPSENVIYELGAAGILWERKIIGRRRELPVGLQRSRLHLICRGRDRREGNAHHAGADQVQAPDPQGRMSNRLSQKGGKPPATPRRRWQRS